MLAVTPPSPSCRLPTLDFPPAKPFPLLGRKGDYVVNELSKLAKKVVEVRLGLRCISIHINILQKRHLFFFVEWGAKITFFDLKCLMGWHGYPFPDALYRVLEESRMYGDVQVWFWLLRPIFTLKWPFHQRERKGIFLWDLYDVTCMQNGPFCLSDVLRQHTVDDSHIWWPHDRIDKVLKSKLMYIIISVGKLVRENSISGHCLSIFRSYAALPTAAPPVFITITSRALAVLSVYPLSISLWFVLKSNVWSETWFPMWILGKISLGLSALVCCKWRPQPSGSSEILLEWCKRRHH